jgi:CarD family transcriptional regulator
MPKKKAKKTVVKKAVKAIKAKVVKKTPAKKAVIKKTVAKKPQTKKKIVTKKVVTKKPAPKSSPKKTASQKKPSKKVQKEIKKPQTKKIEKAQKETKQPERKATNLAKKILATTKNKKEKKVEEVKVSEKKNDAPQKAIIVRKSEGRNKTTFKIGDYAVYPSHGIGKIADIEKTSVLGQDFSCYLMYFEKEKLTIKIPMNSAEKIGLRHLISKSQMDEVFVILRSGVKKLKGMWSRRAQEYETKINSGDIMLLAEVLRDLTRDIEDGERSYSERIIYETAIYRLANEYSAIYGIDFEEAKDKVVITAKDKLNSEGRITQKDEFDEFDLKDKDSDSEDDEENEDEEEEEDEEDEDDDFDYDDDEDDAPKKRKKK